jgi:hypothetical protein
MDGTITLQGSFTQPATAVAQYIPLRSDVDYMKVYNITQSIAVNNGSGFEFYWQRGFQNDAAMNVNGGLVHYHPAGDHTMAIDRTAANAFVLYDNSANPNGALRATTGSSAAANPVVLAANTAGLVAFETIVRLDSIAAAPTICGIDYTVQAINAGVSFTLPTHATALGAGGAGRYRIIQYNPLFYPRNRTVINVSQAAQAVVTTSVNHNYTIGQQVRFVVPANCGMTQLNGLQATIVAVSAAGALPTFTIDLDTTGFTAFQWPLLAVAPTSYANVVPIGENTATALAQVPPLSGLEDATINTGSIGMILMPGDLLPGGVAADRIYWVAGKSFSNS